MIRFLSHEQTKADFVDYLGNKTLDYNRNSQMRGWESESIKCEKKYNF